MLAVAMTSLPACAQAGGEVGEQAELASAKLSVEAAELNSRIADEMVKQATDGTEDFGPVVDDLKSFVDDHPGTPAAEDVLSYAAGRLSESYYSDVQKAYAIELWLDYLEKFPKGSHRNEAVGYLSANDVPLPGE